METWQDSPAPTKGIPRGDIPWLTETALSPPGFREVKVIELGFLHKSHTSWHLLLYNSNLDAVGVGIFYSTWLLFSLNRAIFHDVPQKYLMLYHLSMFENRGAVRRASGPNIAMARPVCLEGLCASSRRSLTSGLLASLEP